MRKSEKPQTLARYVIPCLYLFLLTAVLSVKGDSYIPFLFPSSKEMSAYLNAGLSLILCLSFVLIFSMKVREFLAKKVLSTKIVSLISKFKVPIFIIILFAETSLAFLVLRERLIDLPNLGINEIFTNLDYIVILLILTTGAVIVLIPLLNSSPKTTVVSIFIAAFLFALASILYMPISAKLADLMPIIEKQLGALLKGEGIYQYFLLDNGVLTQSVRQPGTTLSYMPAYIVGLDVRFMSVVFTLLTGYIMLRFSYDSLKDIHFDNKFFLTITVLVLFLLFPYHILRFDLYDPASWFLISLSLLLIKKDRYKWFSFLWGIGIFTQVWFWLFTPFVALYLWKKHGFIKATLETLSAIIIGLGGLLIFILPDPSAYFEHTLEFYRKMVDQGIYAPTTMHMTPLLHELGLKSLLLPLQVIGVGITGILSIWRLKSFGDLVKFLTIAIFIFIQFNSVSWDYMYIIVILLIMIYLLNEINQKKLT